jgi:hypothetical protein
MADNKSFQPTGSNGGHYPRRLQHIHLLYRPAAEFTVMPREIHPGGTKREGPVNGETLADVLSVQRWDREKPQSGVDWTCP